MPTYTLKVDEVNTNFRLDVFLVKNLPDEQSRTFIQGLIKGGLVTVNGQGEKSHYKTILKDTIVARVDEKPGSELLPENIPLDVFYEDDDVLVVNKPGGMLVHPATGKYTGTLVNAVLYHCRNLSKGSHPLRPGIVHRLDQETSGLILVAKNDRAHKYLARQFERREIFKKYVAVVEGQIEFDEGMVDAPLGRHPRHREKKAVSFADSKEAATGYHVLKRSKNLTLVALFPQTGRTHQLRVHMAYLGHPIAGDAKYGKKSTFPRLALHAQAIGFHHPVSKRYFEFSTKTPSEFLIPFPA